MMAHIFFVLANSSVRGGFHLLRINNKFRKLKISLSIPVIYAKLRLLFTSYFTILIPIN